MNDEKTKIITTPFSLVNSNTGKVYNLFGKHNIGRKKGYVKINDDAVSDKHASLEVFDERIALLDYDSVNGTKLNGKRIKPNKQITVKANDIIHFANNQFTLRDTNVPFVENEIIQNNKYISMFNPKNWLDLPLYPKIYLLILFLLYIAWFVFGLMDSDLSLHLSAGLISYFIITSLSFYLIIVMSVCLYLDVFNKKKKKISDYFQYLIFTVLSFVSIFTTTFFIDELNNYINWSQTYNLCNVEREYDNKILSCRSSFKNAKNTKSERVIFATKKRYQKVLMKEFLKGNYSKNFEYYYNLKKNTNSDNPLKGKEIFDIYIDEKKNDIEFTESLLLFQEITDNNKRNINKKYKNLKSSFKYKKVFVINTLIKNGYFKKCELTFCTWYEAAKLKDFNSFNFIWESYINIKFKNQDGSDVLDLLYDLIKNSNNEMEINVLVNKVGVAINKGYNLLQNELILSKILLVLTKKNLLESAKKVLSWGADPNYIIGNSSSLIESLKNSNLELLSLLLKFNANPLAKTKDHKSAWNFIKFGTKTIFKDAVIDYVDFEFLKEKTNIKIFQNENNLLKNLNERNSLKPLKKKNIDEVKLKFNNNFYKDLLNTMDEKKLIWYLRKNIKINNSLIHGTDGLISTRPLFYVLKYLNNENESKILQKIKLLNKNGANFDFVTFNKTRPLVYASENSLSRVVFYMLTNNAFVDGIDINGNTSLMKASSNGNHVIVKYLLMFGADINLTNHNNYSALDFALNNNHLGIIKMLNNCMEKISENCWEI
jgi:hypothetical protein